jgi:aminopeptidase-like protein
MTSASFVHPELIFHGMFHANSARGRSRIITLQPTTWTWCGRKDLSDSFAQCLRVLQVLEANKAYLNQNPKCEPQLGRRGLYRKIGGETDSRTQELAMLWLLNQSDGSHTLLDIAEESGLEFGTITQARDALVHHGLLKERSEEAPSANP